MGTDCLKILIESILIIVGLKKYKLIDGHQKKKNWSRWLLLADVDEVTLKINDNEALSDESVLKSNSDEALNNDFS